MNRLSFYRCEIPAVFFIAEATEFLQKNQINL